MKMVSRSKIKLAIVALAAILFQGEVVLASVASDLKTAASLVIQSKSSFAEKLLNNIISHSSGENKNEAILIFARMRFQDQKFGQAILAYKQIPATSKFWVTALEERAWAELNLSHFENAISLYNTLSSQALSASVGPEAYLIGGIADLRICNYKGIFDDIKLFKERFRPRIEALKKLDTKSAQQDLGDIQGVIKKMHIIEIEAIQRIGLKRQVGEDLTAPQVHSRDVVVFPKESEEWLDESKFEVQTKHCAVMNPAKKVSALKSGDKK